MLGLALVLLAAAPCEAIAAGPAAAAAAVSAQDVLVSELSSTIARGHGGLHTSACSPPPAWARCEAGLLVKIQLSNCGLRGQFPELAALPALERLDLSGNELSGPIPDLCPLARLRSFNVSGNSMLWGDVASHNRKLELRYTVQCRFRFTHTEVPAFTFNRTTAILAGIPLNAGNPFYDSVTAASTTCTGSRLEYLADEANGTWVGSYTDLQGVFHPVIDSIYALRTGVYIQYMPAQLYNLFDLLRGRTARLAVTCGPNNATSCVVFRCDYVSPLCSGCRCINGTTWNGAECQPKHGDGILVPGEQCEKRGLGCNVMQATEATCGSAAGCRWCESYQMCLDSGAYCEACTELSADLCSSYSCAWCDSTGACSPASTCVQCDSLEQPRCGDFSGCSWSYYASSCVSRERAAQLPTCASITNYTQCSARAGCTWCEVTASCWDGPSDCKQCSALATATACAPPCAWCNASSHCLFQQPCTACAGRTAPECAADPFECSWCRSSQVCALRGSACSQCANATREGECATSPGCRWCSSNASCVDASDGFAAACLCQRQQRDACAGQCKWCDSTQICSDIDRSCPICRSFAAGVCRNMTACAYCDMTAQCSRTTSMCVTCDKIGRMEQCLAWRCHWANGLCSTSNYTSQPSQSSEAELRTKNSGTSMIAIYAGAAGGAGSVLLICAVAAAVFVARLRRSAKHKSDNNKHSVEPPDAGGVMASPQGMRTTGPVDNDADVAFNPSEVHVKKASAMSVVEITIALRNLRGHGAVVTLKAPTCPKMAVSFSSTSVRLGPRKTVNVTLYLTPKCSAAIHCCAEATLTPGTPGIKLPIVVNVAPSCFLDMDDLEFGEVVGEGCYGKVSRGRWKGQPVALKEVIQLVKDLEETRREIDLLSRLRSPYIVTFFGTAMTADRTVLVMELAEYGNLASIVEKKPELLTDTLSKKIACDICAGMAFLHASSIVHRDLKAENVLVFTLSESPVNAKVSDFGTSRMSCKNHGFLDGRNNGMTDPLIAYRKPFPTDFYLQWSLVPVSHESHEAILSCRPGVAEAEP
eukprot:m51a1_g6825 putative protein serine threonine (1047) ;mRNA; f:27996-33365